MLVACAKDSPLYVSSRIIQTPTRDEFERALSVDATARRILSKGHLLKDGDRVGARLNLNVLKSTGLFVNTVHAPTNKTGYRNNKGWWSGAALTLMPVTQLRDCFFNCQQSAREKIASGLSNKYPMSSADGEAMCSAPVRFDGIEVRFNPKRERLFVDANGWPIKFAEEATIVGTRVFVRGEVHYYEHASEAPVKAGDSPCAVVFPGDQITRLRADTRL